MSPSSKPHFGTGIQHHSYRICLYVLLFHMYACSIYMHVYVLHFFLVPVEARRGYQVKLLELELWMIVRNHVGARKQTKVFSESSNCSAPLCYLSSLCSSNSNLKTKTKTKHVQDSSFGNFKEIHRISQWSRYKISGIQILIS